MSSVSAAGATFLFIYLSFVICFVWILAAWLRKPLETSAWITPKDKEPPGVFPPDAHYKVRTSDPSCAEGKYNLNLFRRWRESEGIIHPSSMSLLSIEQPLLVASRRGTLLYGSSFSNVALQQGREKRSWSFAVYWTHALKWAYLKWEKCLH